MHRMREIVKVVYEKNTQEDWDTVWVVCGDEGTGKSNFSLHIVDQWYSMLKGECVEDDIKHVCLDSAQFSENFKDMQKYECTDYDEAGELTNRRVMSNFNVMITRAYAIIRGDNLFTILTHPDFFELDPFFVKRRVRGLVYVYKREKSQCRFAFWSKRRLRELVMLNAHRYVKSYWLVPPTHRGVFPMYKGVLRDAYLQKKSVKTAGVRQKLYEDLRNGVDNSVSKEVEVIAKLSKHFGRDQVAVALGVSEKTIYRREKEYKKSSDIKTPNSTLVVGSENEV